ncbi:MAG: transcriptional regulator [Xanthobacteraceae bacterium]|jgi:CheY-like chemotaxis protein|nr:transcriptional regulator [Xanthobacteraceae bacterium]
MTFDQAASVLLYVEDDVLQRASLEDALKEAGFAVTAAHNGQEAISQLEAEAAAFSGLVTDVNLGGDPDGWEVARRARELNGSLPVVYVTGDSQNEWVSKGVPNSVMVSKPFAPAQVIVAIASVLNVSDVRT